MSKQFDIIVGLNESKVNEDWSKGINFIFKLNTNSLQDAVNKDTISIGGGEKELSKLYGNRSLRFKVHKANSATLEFGHPFLQLDKNESVLHIPLYDKDFTYKQFGGKKAFNKKTLTDEMENVRKNIEKDLKNAGIKVNQSKVELGDADAETLWKQAQRYNESANISEAKDANYYVTQMDVLGTKISNLVKDIESSSRDFNTDGDMFGDPVRGTQMYVARLKKAITEIEKLTKEYEKASDAYDKLV